MTPPPILDWALVALMGATSCAAGWYGWTGRRRAAHAAQQAEKDANFLYWARTTSIMVTEQDGTVYAATLPQLRRHPQAIIRWASPVLVTVWQAGPREWKEDTHAR